MDGRAEDLAPLARSKGLVVRELDGEILIFDRESDAAHCLNDVAAGVWKRCDGYTTIAEMVDDLSSTSGTRVDEYVIYKALADLSKKDLLLEEVKSPRSRKEMSRRDMMVKSAAAAVIMIPVIKSLSSPSGAYAAGVCTGCVAHNQPCSSTQPCCGAGVNCKLSGCCYLGTACSGTGTCGVCSGCECQPNSHTGCGQPCAETGC